LGSNRGINEGIYHQPETLRDGVIVYELQTPRDVADIVGLDTVSVIADDL